MEYGKQYNTAARYDGCGVTPLALVQWNIVKTLFKLLYNLYKVYEISITMKAYLRKSFKWALNGTPLNIYITELNIIMVSLIISQHNNVTL